ncbi:MAG: DUF2938 domain-containing protein [Pseudohongiella sp.]|nr:DUF2938 domain-containing protein [Pseudohongiella sp.]
MDTLVYILLIGIGATAVMDLWAIVRKTLFGIPPPNYRMVGRWIAHMSHGQFCHNAIAASSPMHGEHVMGWTIHYLTGIAFAAILIVIWGDSWIRDPAIGPALVVGIGTVALPFLLMQPGMGSGIAASRTANPASARLQSFITHAVFGFGLYVSGWALRLFTSM